MNCFEFICREKQWLFSFRRKVGFLYGPIKLEIGNFGLRLLEDFLVDFQSKTCRNMFSIWGEVDLCRYIGYRICCFIVSPNIPALISGKDSLIFFSF